MSDVTVTLGADSAEFKQALTEIQKSMDVLVNSTTAKRRGWALHLQV